MPVAEINGSVENIGARITVDAGGVRGKVAPLAKNADLSKFIL